jgi:hypothetical protein
MTGQGSASGRFAARSSSATFAARRSRRKRWAASRSSTLDYLMALDELQPQRARLAAIRWHGRLELESDALRLTESQVAPSALASLCAVTRLRSTRCDGCCARFARRSCAESAKASTA